MACLIRAAPRGFGGEGVSPTYTFGFLYLIAIVTLTVFADYLGRDRSADPRNHCWPLCSDTHDVVERVMIPALMLPASVSRCARPAVALRRRWKDSMLPLPGSQACTTAQYLY